MDKPLSKNMEDYLHSLYYSEFVKYRTPYEKKNDLPATKPDNYQMWKKLGKALEWKDLRNLQCVVEYMGWSGADSESFGFDIPHAMTTISGCKKLIKIDRRYYKEQYQEKGY